MKDFELFARSKGVSSTSLGKYRSHIGFMPRKAESITPTIVEERDMNIAIMDVFSRLMMERIIFLGTEIEEYVSNIICAQLLYLDSLEEKEDDDISMYINSPGGIITDGNAIMDVMDFISNDVKTLCTGMAASMGALILSNGTKGKRATLKRSRVMIHQPLGGAYGQASDIAIEAKEMKRVKKELATTLADNTGNSYRKVVADIDRDNWMTAPEALAYGIIDTIVTKP